MKFSEKKFRSFSRRKQEKVLLEFLHRLEADWSDREKRQVLITQFDNCLGYCEFSLPAGLRSQLSMVMDLREFIEICAPLYRQLARDFRDHDLKIRQQNGCGLEKDQLPVEVLLHNLRSAFNVGSIFRTCECLRISAVYLAGYTPLPVNPKLQKTAMGTIERVAWHQIGEWKEFLAVKREQGILTYALETIPDAPTIYESTFVFPACLLLGNEALGLPEEILRSVDKIVTIPVRGWKNSLNVATAFAVCAYEMFRQLLLQQGKTN